jgi:hypothetical protein
MQPEKIILIPPTHEQTVFTYHVEHSIAEEFLEFLKQHNVTPWRPPQTPEKSGSDGKSVMQIEIDTSVGDPRLRNLMDSFLSG